MFTNIVEWMGTFSLSDCVIHLTNIVSFCSVIVEEQEVRRLQENLKNRIDSFIAVTEAEERNQGFGDRPGDQGQALKAEVSRLNGELDESRSKVALLEAELEEKKKIETLLRQEIDRLRRSAYK